VLLSNVLGQRRRPSLRLTISQPAALVAHARGVHSRASGGVPPNRGRASCIEKPAIRRGAASDDAGAREEYEACAGITEPIADAGEATVAAMLEEAARASCGRL
jgi:hypothetical protein